MLIVGMGLTGNESLLGYWQANEDANDSAGANHGIMAGGATFGTGHDGQAFSLDGANAHVSVPHVSGWDFAEGDFTISTWALLDAPPPKKHYAMMAHTAQDVPWRGWWFMLRTAFRPAELVFEDGVTFIDPSISGMSAEIPGGLDYGTWHL